MTLLLNRQLIAMDGVFNLRDLGHYTTGQDRTQTRRVLRSDALHRIGDAGLAQFQAMGLRTVIDLRYPHEIAKLPDPDWSAINVDYHQISLFDDVHPDLNHQGDLLFDLYQRALDRRSNLFANVMQVMAEAPDGAVLFHCAVGKDRTGLIAAFALNLAGVESDDIIEDYALTTIPMQRHRAQLESDAGPDAAKRAGIPADAVDKLFSSEPVTMRNTLNYIAEQHGSIADYLSAAGLSAAAQSRLRKRLVG